MASSEHNTALPCAFCGLGELPRSAGAPPHGICDHCYGRVVADFDSIELLAIPGAPHRVVLYPVPSDNLSQAGWRDYGDGVGVLVLRFRRNPATFCYSNVTRAWWQRFWKAESMGSYFHSTVRADQGAHPFVKL